MSLFWLLGFPLLHNITGDAQVNLYDRSSLKKLWTVGSTEGTSASTFVDMSGWDGCLIIFVGSSAQGSTGSLIIRQSSATSTAGAYTVTKTSGMNFTTDVNEVILVDCYRPLKRYLSVKPGFSSGYIKGYALRYSGRRQGSTEAQANIVKGFVIGMTS